MFKGRVPPKRTVSRHIKNLLIIAASLVSLLAMLVALRPSLFSFFILQADGILQAGTWEDDQKNWYRAFREEPPAQVKVIHSKYWHSNHFTEEHIYYFEVQTTPEWRDAFLKKHSLTLVSPPTARSFRTNFSSDMTPDWFAPGPVDQYEVWDAAGGFGSVWINKSNGHMHFYDEQV